MVSSTSIPEQVYRPLVLVVDDVEDVRLGYRFLLETAQFRVVEAFSAKSALECLATRKVDVVLADLYMPGSMDGVDLIRAIRALPPPHPAIVAMSGEPHRAARSSLQSARYIGADAALMKPITRDD